MEIKRLSYKHKNNKVLYYIKNYIRLLIQSNYYQAKLSEKLKSIKSLSDDDIEKIAFRLNYYNKLKEPVELTTEAIKLSDLKLIKGSKTYFFDLYEYSRFFNQNLKGHFLFGDITHIPKAPSLVKSRPILNNNDYSILLKWDKVRHFMYIKNDKRPFSLKKDMLVSRGKVHSTQPHRVLFLEKYFGHPMCNIGKVNNNELNSKWKVNRMVIDEQLEYKFILCLEGNDVASNLKWVMSSNSLAVMPKPKFETWFMEGLLIPDYHYVLINDDYSDLESKLNYYINNVDKAIEIIKNANEYVSQFKNKQLEDLISLSVLNKYFEKTNQYKK
ncbi:glycosyl transferase family 90 [Mariniflexile sp. HNIBRBA6329]|uniref:glycosyl transferase family 90 n=1 Tax=Mariniflexile sp. HNIBRBA6329 TaxID=3373088 RepID=UPI0037454D4D